MLENCKKFKTHHAHPLRRQDTVTLKKLIFFTSFRNIARKFHREIPKIGSITTDR